MKKSVELIRAMQKMFAGMLLSNVKYQDPTEVLESIVDDNGDPISIYEQKDIGEFFLNLLDRLQDGLGENKQLIRKVVSADFDRQTMKFGQNPGALDDKNKAFINPPNGMNGLAEGLDLQYQISHPAGDDEQDIDNLMKKSTQIGGDSEIQNQQKDMAFDVNNSLDHSAMK